MNQQEKLDSLQAQIDQAKSGLASSIPASAPETGSSKAVRAGTDLASGLIVGLGAGYLLDRWLHTSPWLLIVGLFVGFVAGFRNLIRDTNRTLG